MQFQSCYVLLPVSNEFESLSLDVQGAFYLTTRAIIIKTFYNINNYLNKTENPSSPYPRALYKFTALGLIWARRG
jgi:hypothetical protein